MGERRGAIGSERFPWTGFPDDDVNGVNTETSRRALPYFHGNGSPQAPRKTQDTR